MLFDKKMVGMGRNAAARRGLTLMELVVVLGVLAATAAILIPMFPNMLRRAHKATDATQTNEISKALQLYQASFVSYPDKYDLLTSGSIFPDYLPWDDQSASTTPFGSFVTLGTLTEDEVKALHRVGVDNVNTMAATRGVAPFHPTMNPYDGATSSAINQTLQFAVLDPVKAAGNMTLKSAIDADPTAKFIVLGIGPRCSMVGQTIQDAPTSVPQGKDFTPDNTYARIGVIFKVSGTEVSRTERARFICAVAMEDDELESTEKDIVGYYEVAAGTN